MAGRSSQDERALYWLGNQLIEHRFPVSIAVVIVTAFFAWCTFQLRLETSFGELLPQDHPFVATHNQYAPTFGGANNIVIMFQVRDGTIFTREHLARIFRMTEALDRVYGINHNQIDSIGHRTTRTLKVSPGGGMRVDPVMLRPPQVEAEVHGVRRIVHNSQQIRGILVSL
ncbi:MAG: transporter, partial [Candidatus Binatia bacterium]